MVPSLRGRLYLGVSLFLNVLIVLFVCLDSPQSFNLHESDGGHWASVADSLHTYGWLAARTEASEETVREGRISCGMCDVAPRLCTDLGEGKLQQAIGYSGSNVRLQRFLEKAATGQGFTVGVIGGSVAKGHGLNQPGVTNEHNPRNLARIIFDHLDALYPAPNGIALGKSGNEDGGGKNGFINGAQGGTGSGYFSLCFKEHIPLDVDLILIELSINDEMIFNRIDSYELMVRGLLDMPNQPAIINLQILALMFSRIGLGGDLHESVAQYYDIPIISLRNVVLPDILANNTLVGEYFHVYAGDVPEDDLSNVDKRHLSWQGHRLMGDLTNAYLDTVRCQMKRDKPDKTALVPPLPRLRLMQQWDRETITPKIEPECWSANAEKHKLVPLEANGWREWNWEHKHYLVADKPGSTISFTFSVALGTVTFHYLRSAEYGLGSVMCWIDRDKKNSKRADGYWSNNYSIGQGLQFEDIERGQHTLHCELLEETDDPEGGHEFRIISVMSV